jgi:hypothetical protein
MCTTTRCVEGNTINVHGYLLDGGGSTINVHGSVPDGEGGGGTLT